MSDTTITEYMRRRRRELEAKIAHENENANAKFREAERHKANASEYTARLDELDHAMKAGSPKRAPENVIQMRRPDDGGATKASLRYRNPGATTDIVTLTYNAPGTEIDVIVTTIHEKYKYQGTTRDTVGKMVRRMIREGYARCDGTKLYLTEKCKMAWESSPLYRAS